MGRFPAVCDCDHVGCCTPCPSCANLRAEVDAKDARIRELEQDRADWTRWKEIASSRVAVLEKVVKESIIKLKIIPYLGMGEMTVVKEVTEMLRAALDAAKEGK